MNRVLSLLGISVRALLAIGLLVIASASGGNGMRIYGNPNHFVIQQFKWLGLSLIVMFVAASFNYRKWRDYSALTWGAYAVVVLLLAAVFLFEPTKGSRRWIVLGSALRLQPSEFAKLLAVIAPAVFIDRAGWRIELFWKGAFRAVAIVALLMVLVVAEPDFGATMVIALAGGTMFLLSGMKVMHMFLMGGLAAVGVGTLLVFNANRMSRIAAWLPKWVSSSLGVTPEMIADKGDKGFQLNQALVAIRNGGLTGSPGLFRSNQKLAYLPEAHTDFIFAIGAEEWGLVFSGVLLLLFAIIFVCGIIISMRAPDRFGRLIAFGMTFLVVFQATFNMGVVSGIFPTKGMALPFISYGGTNLMAAMAAIGFLFNVGRQIELPKPRPRSTISANFSEEGVSQNV